MKVLLIHNKYQQPGGEDVMYNAELELLLENKNTVENLVFDNKDIRTAKDKLLSGFKAVYNPVSANELRNKIEKFHPDVIHVHNFFPLASPSIFYAANKYRTPVVVTLHNFRLICPSATLFYNRRIYEKSIHSMIPVDAILKGVYRNSMVQTASVVAMSAVHNVIGTWKNKVNKYIVLTQFAKEKFQQSVLHIPEEKFVAKPNFVKDFGDGQSGREDYFLFIGRLSEEKGIDFLLEATLLYDFKLTIIGDGPLRPKVEEFARVNPNIRYLGFQHKPAIMYYLKRSLALIFTSLCYEGYPLTILEALSTGTPIIASGLGSVKEILTDGENGLFFEPGDKVDLVRKINFLEEHQDLQKKFSHHARETYLERYTPEKNYSILRGIYDQVIQESHEKIARKGVIIPDRSRGLMRRQIAQKIGYNIPAPLRNGNPDLPLVSVGIPTFNSNGAILKTVASVINQYPNLEVIISDNASEDNTEALCLEICKKYPQIKYFRQKENIGLMPNFDFLLKQATGEYFIWVSDDDSLAPEVLQKYVVFLNDHPEYTLVSGQINYLSEGQSHFVERNLNLEQYSPWKRVLAYYFKVVQGGMYHGLMRRNLAAEIPIQKIIGHDWHFVASLAFEGKIKNFEFTGYNKTLGGSSRTFEQFASLIGDSPFAGKYPYLKIAMDAFSQITYHCAVYKDLPKIPKMMLAVSAMATILISHYGRIYPFVIGGKVKRFFRKLLVQR